MYSQTTPTEYTCKIVCCLPFEWEATDKGYKITLENKMVAEIDFSKTLSSKTKKPSLDKIQTAAMEFIEGIRRNSTTLSAKIRINQILDFDYFDLKTGRTYEE